jgi:hypothetical protein
MVGKAIEQNHAARESGRRTFCLHLPIKMYRTDPSAARELLVALEDAQPASDRARMLRKKLFPENQ